VSVLRAILAEATPEELAEAARLLGPYLFDVLDGQSADGRWVRGAKGIAAHLDLSTSTVEKLIARGELAVYRPMGSGGPILAHTADLDRWAGER
jgi:excisionase family DNA binding protein